MASRGVMIVGKALQQRAVVARSASCSWGHQMRAGFSTKGDDSASAVAAGRQVAASWPSGGSSAAKRSQAVFPAGSNGEFDLPAELSLVINRGKDARVWDTEGREFIDFSIGWGSVLVGHAREEVVEAVQKQAALGSNFAYINEPALELAERIAEASPAVEQLRFCASGTEATMYCQRLARAFTGRTKILKFEGAYHGANEIGVTSLFPKKLLDYPAPDPSSAGIAHAVLDHVLVAPYNDAETTKAIIEEHKDELAAIIVEPLHRCTPPTGGFLHALRAAATEAGALLIFDEVVTGFRLAYGGAQEYYTCVPDMVAYGKALGGGYPIGVFGGRRDVMALVEEHRLGQDEQYVWTASSLGGNPITSVAALAALDIYKQPDTYDRLHAIGAYMRQGMRDVLKANDIQAQVIGDGPLAQIVFSPQEVLDYREQKRTEDATMRRAMMLGLFQRGIFLNPIGTKFYMSLRHTEADMDAFHARLNDTFEAIVG